MPLTKPENQSENKQITFNLTFKAHSKNIDNSYPYMQTLGENMLMPKY
jgi:hypothetical protein